MIVTGEIDGWRVTCWDECPQFVDFATEKGNNRQKVGRGKGTRALPRAYAWLQRIASAQLFLP